MGGRRTEAISRASAGIPAFHLLKKKASLRPFMGVDGEGCGVDRQGRQHYKLLRAGPHELYTGRHLRTVECFDFLCSLPAKPLLVGFSFGYDTTQILRDLPAERLDWLFADRQAGRLENGGYQNNHWTYWGDYAVEYIPKNYLRVGRLDRGVWQLASGGAPLRTCRVIEGSVRTVYETFGFFQKSFLAALQDFEVGREHWELIRRNKEARDTFSRITKEIREYCRLECELLAELMEAFRSLCYAADIRPKTWNGAGKLSAFLHDRHGTPSREAVTLATPAGVREMAAHAYYGGRFEVTRIGEIPGPVYESDIVSAYPAASTVLPCLLHGSWEPFERADGARGLYVAKVHFAHPRAAALCGLPIRKKDGRLFWPREGVGTYWSVEISSARKLGAAVQHMGGWRYEPGCSCRPFAWVPELFKIRLALGKDKRGYPLKLALNSLYGKLAQRIGNPRWSNLIWSGMITAITRAWLNDAISQCPNDVVMIATDAIFSRRKLALQYGEGLGEWEQNERARLFIVQPGLYFGGSRAKTRGVPVSVLADHIDNFERQWRLWCATARDLTGPPVIGVPMPLFTGLRLAYARGKPETAGAWVRQNREFSFDWSRKRDPRPAWETPECVRTRPCAGAPDLESVPHPDNLAWAQLDEERMIFDDQPDYLDLGPVQ